MDKCMAVGDHLCRREAADRLVVELEVPMLVRGAIVTT